MKLSGALPRLRLIDAVAIAALALLGVKLLGLASAPAPAVATPAEPLPPFARVLSHARTNYLPPEVSITGATTPKEEATDKPSAGTPPAEPSAPMKPGFEPPAPASSASERALLEKLGERRDELLAKGRELETRTKLIENAERKLDARINELKALEEKTESSAAKKGETEVGAIKNLVIMYESMKPKEAARVFDRLALDVLVPVVLQMNPRKMAEVLAAMSPEAAEKLTVALAARARGLSTEARAGPPPLPPNELPAIEPAPTRPGR